MINQQSIDEQTYLKNYDITSFDRPSLAVDIALFSIMQNIPAKDFRHLDENALKILLIKRGSHPCQNMWALPGGFCQKYEDVKDAAQRELFEETHINNAFMKLINAYGEKNRDARGWIISNTFLSLINSEDCVPRAGTDAWESKWFTITLNSKELNKTQNQDVLYIELEHTLQLTDNNIIITNIINEKRTYTCNTLNTEFTINRNELAFDHAKIILESLLELRHLINYNKSYIFNIMPKTFTLNQLQSSFELILDKPLIKANFNRDIKKYVQETGNMISTGGHRPSKEYKRSYNYL